MKKQILLCLVLCFCGCLSAAAAPLYYQGQTLDFSGMPAAELFQGDDFMLTNQTIEREGVWVALPSRWEDVYPGYKGICWYRIGIVLDRLPADSDRLGISLGEIEVADETYLNGRLIGRTGDIDKGIMAYDIPRIYYLPAALLQTGRTNILAIRARGGFGISGPIKGRMAIGDWENLQAGQRRIDVINLVYTVIYLLLALNFLMVGLFLRQEKYNLTFSLFSLSVFVFLLARNQLTLLFINDFHLLKYLEYAAVLLPLPLFAWFIAQYFDPAHEKPVRLYFLLNLLPLTAMLLIPDMEHRYQLLLIMQYTWVLPAVYIIGVVIWRILSRDRDALLVLPSVLVGGATIILDVLRTRVLVQTPMALFPLGGLFFVLSFALILNRKLVSLYSQVRQLNQRLEEEVDKRTEKLRSALDELMEVNQALEGMTLIDVLTGIYNRRYFNDRFEAELQRIRRYPENLSLIMLDIDDFKQVNDTYGHPTGDIVLQQVARNIQAALHRDIDFAARYGGEEFAVLLPHTNANSAAYLAEAIRKSIERLSIPTEQGIVKVTVSLGVASRHPQQHSDYDRILQLADKALYSAKAYGKNRVHNL